MFIEVHDEYNNVILVNARFIYGCSQLHNSSNKPNINTAIKMINHDKFEVRETPEQIGRALSGCANVINVANYE